MVLGSERLTFKQDFDQQDTFRCVYALWPEHEDRPKNLDLLVVQKKIYFQVHLSLSVGSAALVGKPCE
uniref:Uncharacterized protein n=1 Tax=Physcomitrium patens TaxID=3218 RepID=A0A2K1KXH6_PHYPA|nr:hypothetical protein PHYPA_005488 [Physcomitrium patens]